jgi:hypothetical protein
MKIVNLACFVLCFIVIASNALAATSETRLFHISVTIPPHINMNQRNSSIDSPIGMKTFVSSHEQNIVRLLTQTIRNGEGVMIESIVLR